MGVLGCTRKATIPHRLSAEPPLHKGAFGFACRRVWLPGRIWNPPLRKTIGLWLRKVARGVGDAAPYGNRKASLV